MTFLKLVALVVILNAVRYVAGAPIEMPLVVNRMHAIMPQFPSAFNVDLPPSDFKASLAYNFVLWFTATLVFHIMHPRLKGNMVVKSLQSYGLSCLSFISLAAIYMNHFNPPLRPFFLYSMADALIVFAIVALANGLVYPLLFRRELAALETHG